MLHRFRKDSVWFSNLSLLPWKIHTPGLLSFLIYVSKLPHSLLAWEAKFYVDDTRPWDYLENFGICSQLDRKSKTWFFTFLNVYIFWIERDKILISQLSPPKFRYFADQNGPKGRPRENEFWQFSNGKMSFLNS